MASVNFTAIARATAVTLMECVSRLWMSGPAPGCAITWVTAESREKYGENRMRSRSSRNCECSPVTSALLRGSGTRRDARSIVMRPIYADRPVDAANPHADRPVEAGDTDASGAGVGGGASARLYSAFGVAYTW